MVALKKESSILLPVKDAGHRSAIMSAIADFDLRRAPAWKDVEALSPNAEVEIEANPEGVFEIGNGFEATATVYVRLPETQTSNVDSFPAHVVGRVSKNNKVSITKFSVDTSSFFGGPDIPWHSERS